MAAHILALYNTPKDPTAFEQYYHGTHIPIAKGLPGLRSFSVSRGAIAAPGATAPYYFIAVLVFDSVAAIEAALGSPEGQATVADVANFATGGATIMMYETVDV